MLSRLTNYLAVQLFRRVPWVTRRWARTHRFVEGGPIIPWARLARPLRDATVALVTTAGVHLRSDPPFDMDDPDGDPSFRAIPAAADRAALVITHRYYDHTAADRDLNVVLPIDRLRELVADGVVGGIGPTCYGFMGHIDGRHLRTLIEVTAPAVAARLRADRVEAAFLTPS
jgi:D-proline reductase (dithiol) PrdB